jgi:hypothetical protein
MASLTPAERMLIEWECTKLVHRFNWLNDRGRFEEAAECFAPDASYLTPASPDPVAGREALVASFSARPPWTFRHFVTNLFVDAISSTEARGHSAMLVAFNSGPPTAPTAPTPAITGEVDEHFVLTESGWRFGHRRGYGGIPLGVTLP